MGHIKSQSKDGKQKILLVDVDSTIPNLPLMKLSTFHKQQGKVVELLRLKYDGKPGKRQRTLIRNKGYEQVYISIIFTPNKDVIKIEDEQLKNYQFGGTGTLDFSVVLPKEIDDLEEDYSLYPDNEEAIGFVTRGCIRNCLSGDTLINTLEGDIPIKDLVGKKSVPVYTYDPETKEVFITNAFNIVSQGEKEIVRVSFDDGSWIDCTPDHKFLTFKNGNQSVSTKETIKEAKDLKYHESVRAFKLYTEKSHGNWIKWGRNKGKRKSVLIMEFYLNRKLQGKEVVHHLDENCYNDVISNLQLCKDGTDHWRFHREKASQRMKEDNPSKYWTAESAIKLSKSLTGKKRTYEQKLRYRESKLGDKNPMYKHGNSSGLPSRIKDLNQKQINHRVISVSPIGKAETFDLEVPATNWFFANKVLVHNCSFCYVARKEGYLSQYRDWRQIVATANKYGLKKIRFLDNNALANPNFNKVAQELIDNNIRCSFNEGLDFRLITDKNAELLSKLRYYPTEYIFAFDNVNYLPMIEKQYKIIKKHIKPNWKIKFYCYVHPDMPLKDTVKRLEWCRKNKALVYIMKDKACYSSLNKNFYRDLCSWANAPGIYKNHDFFEHMKRKSKDDTRIMSSLKLYRECLKEIENE